MAIFKQGDDSCYFIHIPRTGGRYVTSLFENSKDIECKFHQIEKHRIKGIEIIHLHYPLYEYYLEVEDLPHITVVRNPFDKFVSCLNCLENLSPFSCYKLINSEKKFINFVNEQLNRSSFHNNWFLPQHKFISPKTYYWKYEWGFGNEFREWVYDKTKIDIKIQEVNYEKFEWEHKKRYNLNENIKKFVEEFYEKDYQEFEYFL